MNVIIFRYFWNVINYLNFFHYYTSSMTINLENINQLFISFILQSILTNPGKKSVELIIFQHLFSALAERGLFTCKLIMCRNIPLNTWLTNSFSRISWQMEKNLFKSIKNILNLNSMLFKHWNYLLLGIHAVI